MLPCNMPRTEEGTCAVAECDRGVETREWCGKHYQRWLKYGDPLGPPRPTDKERFLAKVQKDEATGCWLWTAARHPTGYGAFGLGGRGRSESYAHRAAHILWKGPIGEGLQIDHLCRVKHCVNPEHLEAVTPLVNTRRSLPHQDRQRRTHCFRGHELTPANTIVRQWKGQEKHQCRTCENEGQLRRYHARQAALAELLDRKR